MGVYRSLSAANKRVRNAPAYVREDWGVFTRTLRDSK
jgi:hypothetical protein